MKKRIVSLLLALCLLAGLLPAVTPQADAVISTVIGTSLKMCTSLVKGGIYACRNGSEYDNAGQGVLAVFKYAGSVARLHKIGRVRAAARIAAASRRETIRLFSMGALLCCANFPSISILHQNRKTDRFFQRSQNKSKFFCSAL